MSGPLVSVVVPAFNAERYLARTLTSASAQTHPDLEIVVVDDGSTDRTAEIVRAAAAADPRIRLVRQSNAGVAAARNRGIDDAQGHFIAPLDADDLWHPEKIERQLRRFAERPECGLVYCWSIGIDEDDRVVSQRISPASFEGDVFAAIAFQNFIGNASAPLIRRDCLEAVGGFDETLRAAGGEGCEDRKLYLDLAARYDFTIVPLFLVGYRQIAGSMSWNHTAMLRSHELIMAEIRARGPELPARIFRWSLARTEFYLGLRAISSRHAAEGLALCASAFCRDPNLLFSHWARYSVSRGLRKLANIRSGERAPFARSPIDREISPPGWAVRRQRSFAAAIRSRGHPADGRRLDHAARAGGGAVPAARLTRVAAGPG